MLYFSKILRFSKVENSSDVECRANAGRRGRCSRKKTGPLQEAPVVLGETEMQRREGAPEAQGETEESRRGEGDAQAKPGETTECRRAEGAQAGER